MLFLYFQASDQHVIRSLKFINRTNQTILLDRNKSSNFTWCKL